MNPQLLTKLYHKSAKLLELLPEKQQIKIASLGRSYFMQQFANQKLKSHFVPDEKFSRKLWGIEFRSPIMNAAGMFKNGEAYDVVAALGAGGYIGGTSTSNSRVGNSKDSIKLPFITLPNSHVAINWLGLPNLGDDILSRRIITQNKISGCPIAWSVMRSPDFTEMEGLDKLINSLFLYQENELIDFLELNESCPNVKSGGGSIIPRLAVVSEKFLKNRNRHLPVVVKLSNDVSPEIIETLLPEIIRLGFDGVNLGNTSTSYAKYSSIINESDKLLFDFFTKTFGGGVSGVVLNHDSLKLCSVAAEIVAKMHLDREFHIIRTGGVSSVADIIDAERAGCSLNQWYTGFFDRYNVDGNAVYHNMLKVM